ncbi:MAG TPA: cytidylate kinase-like family protein [Caproiciproducens sp.]|nr:cytidylate kinase-like family protein [Caproiciproducens sp.]
MSNAKVIISISRQFGSGGREIGQKLAEDLNIPFYDKKRIAIIAQQSGISNELFEKANEKAGSSLLYSLVMGSYTFGSHVPPDSGTPINDRLFSIQADIIKQAAADDPCIFVGRCADYALREYKNVFRVFIRADQSFRMERAVSEYKIKPEEAAEFLVKKDRQRANYYSCYTQKKWGDPDNYHLVLDSSAFGIRDAVELIKSAAAMLERQLN